MVRSVDLRRRDALRVLFGCRGDYVFNHATAQQGWRTGGDFAPFCYREHPLRDYRTDRARWAAFVVGKTDGAAKLETYVAEKMHLMERPVRALQGAFFEERIDCGSDQPATSFCVQLCFHDSGLPATKFRAQL